jgi:hypothetical protein
MEENKNITEEAPKYIFHDPKAPDVFTMAGIIGKIGINKFSSILQKEEIQSLAKDVSKKKSISSDDISMITGIGVFTEIAQIILVSMDKCEEDIYKLLSSTSNLGIEEVKDLDGVTFVEMIIDFFKRNVDFIKAASKFVK